MARWAPASERDVSDRQLKLLGFIASSMAGRGFPPTIRELCTEMEIRSTNGVNDHLKALARMGFIDRGAGQARAIVLTPKAYRRLGAKLPLLEAATLALLALEETGLLVASHVEARKALRRAGIR